MAAHGARHSCCGFIIYNYNNNNNFISFYSTIIYTIVRVCVNNLIILCLFSSQLMKNRAKNIAKRRATAAATVAIAICAAAAHAHTLSQTLSTHTHTQTPLERAAIQHSTQKLFWCYFNLKVNRSVICGIKYNSSRERARERHHREREGGSRGYWEPK